MFDTIPTRILTAAVLALTPPACGWAQQETEALEDAGVWHATLDWRVGAPDAVATSADRVRVARAELALGRPERARQLLADWEVDETSLNAEALALRAAIAFATARFDEAGELFARAAGRTTGERRGALASRAAQAFEEAGAVGRAARHYRAAAAEFPRIAGWFAIREAAVTEDTARAAALLRWAPIESGRLAGVAWARALLRAGDTTTTAPRFAAAGEWGQAAALLAGIADSAQARELAYATLGSADTEAARLALAAIGDRFPPRDAAEHLAVARAVRRTAGARDALPHVERAVAAGDSTAQTLRFLAQLQDGGRQRGEALETYGRAARLAGPDATVAAYERARLLLRLRRRAEAHAGLLGFAGQFPEHERAPAAVHAVAEDFKALRRLRGADSLYRVVAARWPRDDYASRARLELAATAVAARDTAAAVHWYEQEIARRGMQRHLAQYLLARLVEGSGDSARARGLWSELAEADPAGYYGVQARRAAALPPPEFTEPVARPATPAWVARDLLRLDLLRTAHLDREADELVRRLVARSDESPETALELADGLSARGWVVEGVHLGWRAAAALSLRDARVLRAIYPWRFRNLIEEEARKHGLDPYLLVALIRQESTFRPAVVSRAGAQGLMQLMPATAAGLARRLGVDWDDAFLTVADANVHLGAAHLAALLGQYRGELIPALAAYNAGSRPVRRWLRFPEASDPFRFVERIPYAETRGFVRSVLRNYTLYRALYPSGDEVTGAQP